MFLIERADEAATLNREERNGIRVLRLGSAHDHLFHAAPFVVDLVAIAKKETARAERGDNLHVRRRLANKVRVVVLEVLARANAFRPARRIRSGRETRDEIRSGSQGLYLVL